MVSRLCTVSIRSRCCFWRAELLTVAVTSCFSSSWMTELCLDTSTRSWSFSSRMDRSCSVCLSSMSSTFFSRKLKGEDVLLSEGPSGQIATKAGCFINTVSVTLGASFMVLCFCAAKTLCADVVGVVKS